MCKRFTTFVRLIFGWLGNGSAEEIAQLQVDEIDVRVQVARQDVMRAVTVGLVALLEVARLE